MTDKLPFSELREQAISQIGQLTEREILIAGAIAYWCEGAKNKPYRRSDRVDFINSDPAMISFFLRFLETAGVPRERLVFALSIHETADVGAAQRFWLEVTGADATQFNKPVLKRHKPTTVRKNNGENYHGCLRIQVRRSISLYRQIEGWAHAVMTGIATPNDCSRPRLESACELPGEDSNLG